MSVKANALMYHHFHDGLVHPKVQGSISSGDFEEGIIYLVKKGYKFLNANEWYEKSLQSKLNDNELCITFDDGLRCQFDVALPILDDYKIKAFWFIYSSGVSDREDDLEVFRRYRTCNFYSIEEFYSSFDREVEIGPFAAQVASGLKFFDSSEYLKNFPFYTVEDKKFRFIRDEILGGENYNLTMRTMIAKSNFNVEAESYNLWMTDSNLKYLSTSGHMIGLHSYSHPTRIAELTRDQQNDEYLRNFQHITTAVGIKPVAMSHPCNSYNQDTLKIIDALGIKLGFCSNPSLINYTNLEYPRIDHSRIHQEFA